MQVEFPGSALKAAADAAAAAARPGGMERLGAGMMAGQVEGAASGSFGSLLMDALRSVSSADKQQRAFEVGDAGATLESTMLAMQKAQIGFQSAVTVRNRLVQAYSDIMGMQV